jgi:hypothetical protein
MTAADMRLRATWLQQKKDNLVKTVHSIAVLPSRKVDKFVSSAAFVGLRDDYIRMCHATVGGLLIVYDKQGTGKSYALQAVARGASVMQPPRFLVINMTGADTCQALYETIKRRVLGEVQDFTITPTELAEVIKYGLCGPSANDSNALPSTKNSCRMDIVSEVVFQDTRNKFPILVIDEFVPTDFFTWDEDYSLQELRERIGDAFEFFTALTGEANTEDGFVVFLGTRTEAFARAIHKINEGSKAALARATTIPNPVMVDGSYLFRDWRGLPWSAEEKANVVRGLYKKKLEDALRGQDLTEYEIDARADNIIGEVCLHDNKNIRQCCETDMPDALMVENEKWRAKVESRAQMSPVAGCFAGLRDVFSFFGGPS